MQSNRGELSSRVLEERVSRAEWVNQSLLELPPDYRVALICKYVEGFTVEEIARFMNRTSSSVQSLLFRARQALRASLESAEVEPDAKQ